MISSEAGYERTFPRPGECPVCLHAQERHGPAELPFSSVFCGTPASDCLDCLALGDMLAARIGRAS